MPEDVEALLTAYRLKDEGRTGWQLRNVEDPESVAGHSWGVALLTLAYAGDAGVDADRALRLAVLHDVGEAELGDVPTRADPDHQPDVSPEEKERRERETVETLAGALGDDVLADWTAYEERETPEARFVKDMDLVDMCVQALYYEREGRYDPDADDAFTEYDRLDEFFATAEPRLSTAVGRDLFDRLRAAYEDAKQ
ncbi:phosphohydrolase [Halobacterium sp. DL1]|jgi:putative hydrolase of HD superfamily|nr:phosphohydrolase [Halobacterium sp. DL1]